MILRLELPHIQTIFPEALALTNFLKKNLKPLKSVSGMISFCHMISVLLYGKHLGMIRKELGMESLKTNLGVLLLFIEL